MALGWKGRTSGTIVADVMADYEARPHWGKLHPRTSADLAPLYPGWDEFQEVRAQLDPHGTFENAELRRVLGPVGG
jgi:FAD/FMN-containing dehydrogenase